MLCTVYGRYFDFLKKIKRVRSSCSENGRAGGFLVLKGIRHGAEDGEGSIYLITLVVTCLNLASIRNS